MHAVLVAFCFTLLTDRDTINIRDAPACQAVKHFENLALASRKPDTWVDCLLFRSV